MDSNYIIRLESCEKIDLSTLSLDELYKLHFEEETYAAEKIKELEPFSESRKDYFKKAYENINKIKKIIQATTGMTNNYSHSKDNACNIIERIADKIKKDKITILELGCGSGTLLKTLSKNRSFELYGCDIQEITNLNNVTIYSETIYETLKKFTNNSLDIIIADNVCEHFLKDEADKIYDLISEKLNKNGYCIFFIPNILIGPADISKRFIKYKEKPLGFHYMEQTYSENIALFNQHQITTAYLYISVRAKRIIIKNIFNIPDKIKIRLERIIDKTFANASKEKRKHTFLKYGYNIYILKHK